ncbi:MAG: hypothetical protein M1830_004075, partial [Pleopsidium flavum]
NKIDRITSSDKGLVISNRNLNRIGRLEKYAFSKNERSGQKELRIQPAEASEAAFESGKNFIALVGSRRRKRELGDNSDVSSRSGSSDEESGNHYRSIKGKAKRSEGPPDRDMKYATDSATSDDGWRRMVSPDEATKQRSIQLSRLVHTQPTNVDAWLDSISHQDDLLRLSTGGTRQTSTDAEKRSIADVKLSMYEKALEKLDGDERVERVVLGMMEEGSKIWDTKKLGSRWRSVLEEYPSFIRLWTKYLDFQQTNFITFQYEECRTIFFDCLKVLSLVSTSNVSSFKIEDDIDRVRIYVLLRLTLFMRESGYVEHAVGLWQGILEFNFFRPKDSGLLPNHARKRKSDQDYLYSFEEFWESEVPRVGEEGAKGWETWTNNGGITAPPRTDASNNLVHEEQIFAGWVRCERRRALQSRNTARTMDEVEENDPFRVILFPDIRDYLFYTANARLQIYLLNAFLAFCRLPSLSSDNAGSQVQGWRKDSLIMNDPLEQSDSFISHWYTKASDAKDLHKFDAGDRGTKPEQTNDANRKSPFNCPVRCFSISADSLFSAKGDWFSVLDAWASSYEGDNGPVERTWIRRVLRTLVDVGAGGDDLAEYYLAYEWVNDSASARKTTKSLLKKHPTSLRLYNTYALIEARAGNKPAVDHVLSTAINMSKTIAEPAQHDTIILWRTLLWECLTIGDHESALKRLLTFPETTIIQDPVPSNPQPAKFSSDSSVAALLKVHRALTDGREYMLSLGRIDHAVLYAECLALLAYLSQHIDISAALEVFRQTSSLLAARNLATSPSNELLHQAKAKFLHHHVTHTSYFKPALIRSELAESIQLFPNNTIFLSLYAWNEARFRIDDRVRSIMRDVVLQDNQDTIIGWYFSIWTELHRGIDMGSNSHSVRATFEKAIDSQSGRSNAGLWKLYLLFEHHQGELQRAKNVFYRGMRGCPWVKGFYMLAFTHLRD